MNTPAGFADPIDFFYTVCINDMREFSPTRHRPSIDFHTVASEKPARDEGSVFGLTHGCPCQPTIISYGRLTRAARRRRPSGVVIGRTLATSKCWVDVHGAFDCAERDFPAHTAMPALSHDRA